LIFFIVEVKKTAEGITLVMLIRSEVRGPTQKCPTAWYEICAHGMLVDQYVD